MTVLTHSFPALLAQQSGGNPLGLAVPMILMFVMMYFLMIRPQQKRQKDLQRQIEAMKIGDQVITSGGIHGLVSNKADKTVTVKIADNVKVKFDQSSISKVLPKSKESDASSSAKEEEEEEDANS